MLTYVFTCLFMYLIGGVMIYSFSTEKGGTSKTVSSLHTGYLSSLEKPTILIDLDPQGDLTSCFTNCEDAFDTIENKDNGVTEKIIKDEHHIKCIFEGKDLEPYKVKDNLYLIGSSDELSNHADNYSGLGFLRLKKYIENTFSDDVNIIIDCPPTKTLFAGMGICASDFVITPTDTSDFSESAVYKTYQSILDLSYQVRTDAKFLGLFFSRLIDYRSIEYKEKKKSFEQNDIMSKYLFSTVVYEREIIKHSMNSKQTIFEYKKTKSNEDIHGLMTSSFENLWKEIKERS